MKKKDIILQEIAKIKSLNQRIHLHLNEYEAIHHLNEVVKQTNADMGNVENDNNEDFIVDLTTIPIDELEKQYVDFRLICFAMSFDNPLHTIGENKENSTSEPLGVVQNAILDKYQLQKWQFSIRQGRNGIEVCLVIPLLGENPQMIEIDMNDFGYFCSKKERTNINDMTYLQMKFEPQFQENISDIVRQYDCIFHATPSTNVEQILNQGLTPQNTNNYLSYPPRIYFIKGDVTEEGQNLIAQSLFRFSNSSEHEMEYTILTIKVDSIPNTIPFYFDPNHEHGIFTNESIPSNTIVGRREIKVTKK